MGQLQRDRELRRHRGAGQNEVAWEQVQHALSAALLRTASCLGLDTGIWDGLPRRRERSPNRTAYDRSLQCCERQDRSRATPGKRRR